MRASTVIAVNLSGKRTMSVYYSSISQYLNMRASPWARLLTVEYRYAVYNPVLTCEVNGVDISGERINHWARVTHRWVIPLGRRKVNPRPFRLNFKTGSRMSPEVGLVSTRAILEGNVSGTHWYQYGRPRILLRCLKELAVLRLFLIMSLIIGATR